MKKFLSALLICGILVFSLTACGNQPESQIDSQTNSSNEMESNSGTNDETTVPNEAAFLPPAEHSNFIAPKAEKGQKYNIKKLDFVNNKKLVSNDENQLILDGKELYDIDGNLLFDDETIKKEYPKEVSNVEILSDVFKTGEKSYVMVSLSENDTSTFKKVLYDYKGHSFFQMSSDNLSVKAAYDDYIVVENIDDYTYALIDGDNNTIIPFDAGYDGIRYLYNNRFVAYNKQGNYADLLNSNGNIINKIPYNLNYESFNAFIYFNSALIENYIFYDRNNLASDYFIGTRHNYNGDDFINVPIHIFDKDGNEVYSTNAPDTALPARIVSQYNGKTYITEFLDDEYYYFGNDRKITKRQLIDEYHNIIIEPCMELSGFFNGYCRTGEYNEGNETMSYFLKDLDGNVIDSTEYPIYGTRLSELSLVDEAGLYVIIDINSNEDRTKKESFYTIKDIAGNVVFASDSEIKDVEMLGNGIFGINDKSISEYEYLITITPA